MREVLTDDGVDPWWSRRARATVEAAREEHGFLEPAGVQLVSEGGQTRLWTFAGGAANRLLARMAEGALGGSVTSNDLSLGFTPESGRSDVAIGEWVASLRAEGRPSRADAVAAAGAFSHLRLSKFQPCLPPSLLDAYLAEVLTDPEGARESLAE
jgi:ATP-dependent Lhr-like helicase